MEFSGADDNAAQEGKMRVSGMQEPSSDRRRSKARRGRYAVTRCAGCGLKAPQSPTRAGGEWRASTSRNSRASVRVVSPYVSLSQQMAPPSPRNSTPNGNGNDQLSKTNLYIRGLQPGTTDQDLVKLCQP
ncbi:hypothetical protein A6R68_00440 [Neotoma lepida]|uniref:RRM domain-containing protein n=1 Tax=Neotoma lepida TaxID=56216 RepID=A0A1A6GXI7_NEOLE|nr:hypothetical protein A6R68_00440 [Neotoma lepida]